MIWKSLLGEVFKLVNSFSDNQAFIRTKSPRFSRTFFVAKTFDIKTVVVRRGTLTDVWDFWDIGYFWDIGGNIFTFRRYSIHLDYKTNTQMLTDQQRVMFREILDVNWELKESKDWDEKIKLSRKLEEKKEALKSSMGEAHYNHFIKIGQQMFAPKVH